MPSPSVAVVGADHDLVGLDLDHDGAPACPVLGEHGIVAHGAVEPETVALVAMVEDGLERMQPLASPAASAPAPLLRLPLRLGLGGRRDRGCFGLGALRPAAPSLRLRGGGTAAPTASPGTSRRRMPFSERNDAMLAGVELSVCAIHTSV